MKRTTYQRTPLSRHPSDWRYSHQVAFFMLLNGELWWETGR